MGVFSSPGVGYSAERFGIYNTSSKESHGIQVLERFVHNMVPAYDVVPRVDMQVAHVDRIACESVKESVWTPYFRSYGMCHSIQRTSCELWRVCGDENRDRKIYCDDAYFVNITRPGQWLDHEVLDFGGGGQGPQHAAAL